LQDLFPQDIVAFFFFECTFAEKCIFHYMVVGPSSDFGEGRGDTGDFDN